MPNQDVFSLCIDDMAASLELVSELENELGDVLRRSDDPDRGAKGDIENKVESRAWAAA